MGFDSNTYLSGPRRLSVPEAVATRLAGGSQMSGAFNPRTGARFTNDQAALLGPLTMGGWQTGGHGTGGYGYGGGVGQPSPEPQPIGSAAGALGSAGVPTSQRGRAEKYGPDAADIPTFQMSQDLTDQFHSTAPDWRYGGMGRLSYAPSPVGGGGVQSGQGTQNPALKPTDAAKHQQIMDEAGNFQPVQQGQSSSQWWNPLAMARNWLNPFNL